MLKILIFAHFLTVLNGDIEFCPFYNFTFEVGDLPGFLRAFIDCSKWVYSMFNPRKQEPSSENLGIQYLIQSDYNTLKTVSKLTLIYKCFNQPCTSIELNCNHNFTSHTKPRIGQPMYEEHWAEIIFRTERIREYLHNKYHMVKALFTCPNKKPCVPENGVSFGLQWKTARHDILYITAMELPFTYNLPIAMFPMKLRYYRKILIKFEFLEKKFKLKYKRIIHMKTHWEYMLFHKGLRYTGFIMKNSNWQQAADICQGKKANLLTVKNKENMDLIKMMLVTGYNQFIGLKVRINKEV